MATNLDKIMEAERLIQKDIAEANIKAEALIDEAIEEATIKANELNVEAEHNVKQLFKGRKARMHDIDLELETVVKRENEKIVSKVSKKKKTIVDRIYKEMIE